MEIQSAFNAGVQGFQKATDDANQAAASIACSGHTCRAIVAGVQPLTRKRIS